MSRGALPVLVGVGQHVSHWDGRRDEPAPSPLSMAAAAAHKALADAGKLPASHIDTLAVVRTMEDSSPFGHPHGKNENLPGTLAREIGATPARAIYSVSGGQCPQALVNEMAAAIHAGEAECALVAGGEAIGASKLARRKAITLDWSDGAGLAFEERGTGPRMLTRGEIKHGLVAPPYFYALFETAIAARAGRGRDAHRRDMSRLFAPFSQVAAANPHAQFPAARDADWLATPSAENYELADPFLKWHIAQDAVNLGAAVLVMSEERADALGVPDARRVYLHGAGEAVDTHISERRRMDGSHAMQVAISRALDQAGLTTDQVKFLDLYSCFPCAVFSACAALGIDPETDPRDLTVTGGLPYFGGPGNNYSLHAIAEMAMHLRARPATPGLVLANGGWMTKEAAGVYSTARPEGFTPVTPSAPAPEPVELAEAPDAGRLETYTVIHGRDGPKQALAFGRTEDGRRFIANADAATLSALRADANQVGRAVTVTSKDEVNTFMFKEPS